MILPKPLPVNGCIGIVCPARTAPQPWLDEASAVLRQAGFRVKIHPHCTAQHGQLAGDDGLRAAALMEYFIDASVDAIICARGGIGAFRLLELLDYGVIAQNPKPFCGFSDITTLLIALYQRANLVTFHAPMLYSLCASNNQDVPYNLAALTRLNGQDWQEERFYAEASCLQAGVAEGTLLGGNMTLLQNLLGSKDAPNPDGALLFIEDDDGEKLSDIDRLLSHFSRCGWFGTIKGLMVGAFNGFRPDPAGAWDRDVTAMLRAYVPATIPICLDFPCGHTARMTLLPQGIKARLATDASATRLTLLEKPFA